MWCHALACLGLYRACNCMYFEEVQNSMIPTLCVAGFSLSHHTSSQAKGPCFALLLMNAGMGGCYCCSGCLFKGMTANVQPPGTPASDRSRWYWYHYSQHAWQNECTLSWLLRVNVTSWVSLGLESHCSSSIVGQWSFPLTILWTEKQTASSILVYE